MKSLTAQQVRQKAFQTVRFKEGYDVEEVDDFLDQVAQTLAQQEQRISYLEGQLVGASSGTPMQGTPMPAAQSVNQGFVPETSSSFSMQGDETMSGNDGFSSAQQVSWEQ